MSELVDAHLIDNSPPEDKARVIKDIVAGTVGGIAQVLAGNPFDTVKVRLQSSSQGQYNGAMDVVKKLIANEGPTGFYKGVLTPLIGVGACVSIQFAVNEYMKRAFTKYNTNKYGTSSILLSQYYTCGLVAGTANSFLASPIEHIRIRLQTQTSAENTLYKGPLDAIKKIYSYDGIRGIFRGLGASTVREAHGLGIYFATYEFLVEQEMKRNQLKRTELEGWKLCTYGGFSGITLWVSTYPIDVIKTRLQTDDLQNKKFKTSLDVTKYLWRHGGIKVFFEGFGVCILRAFPANAVTFYSFELAMRAMG